MDQEVKEIQAHCLKLLDIVDSICRRNNILYSLCGGSVVGAHLYGGCLPWDDDVDLMMTRENYNRFIAVARHELPSNISMLNYQSGKDFTTPFTKIVDDTTTIVQQDGTISGVFLDITVYDRVPDNFLSKIDDFLWKVSQVVMIGIVKHTSLKVRLRNLALRTILRRRSYLKLFEKAAVLLGKSRKYTYSELFGAFANTVRYSPGIFENYIDIQFEGRQCMIVRDYVEYLITRYNRTDFREPVEKQVAPHYRFVSFNSPWREYPGLP